MSEECTAKHRLGAQERLNLFECLLFAINPKLKVPKSFGKPIQQLDSLPLVFILSGQHENEAAVSYALPMSRT